MVRTDASDMFVTAPIVALDTQYGHCVGMVCITEANLSPLCDELQVLPISRLMLLNSLPTTAIAGKDGSLNAAKSVGIMPLSANLGGENTSLSPAIKLPKIKKKESITGDVSVQCENHQFRNCSHWVIHCQ